MSLPSDAAPQFDDERAAMPSVLALGLDPACVDLPDRPDLTPELIRAFIESQLERLRALGYVVHGCLLDSGDTAEAVASARLRAHSFDCVLFGAALRAPERLLLFEKLLNLVHVEAPNAKLCFNTTPADTAEAVRRWV
jgi:hypothetical protein